MNEHSKSITRDIVDEVMEQLDGIESSTDQIGVVISVISTLLARTVLGLQKTGVPGEDIMLIKAHIWEAVAAGMLTNHPGVSVEED